MTGERQLARSFVAFCNVVRASILLILLPVAAQAQLPSIAIGPLQRCPASGGTHACRPTSVEQIDLDDPIVRVRRVVDVPQAAVGAPLPLAVTLVGTMSAEVRWNDVRIGQNGTVGRDAASETPGRFRATILVPGALVRAGRNLLDVRLSAHHRWLPVRTPIHQIGVGYYDGQSNGELRAYWPALLTAGALILAVLYFGVAALVGREPRRAQILAGVALCAALQLGFETSRSFIDYAYPWHIARIAAIVVFAGLTAALIVGYAARRYAPRWTRNAVIASAATSIAALVMLPSFDAKAWACLFAATVICLACAAAARRRWDGRIGMIIAGLFALMLVWWQADALDRVYYLGIAALLAGLVVEQMLGMHQVDGGLAVARARSETLEDRLRVAETAIPSILSFRDGAAIHRFSEADILQIAAADDFCELALTERRPLLVAGTLKAIAESLPDRFVRVHRSYIVNMAHIAAVKPRPGGGHQLLLSDGSLTPVGRTYQGDVLARLQER